MVLTDTSGVLGSFQCEPLLHYEMPSSPCYDDSNQLVIDNLPLVKKVVGIIASQLPPHVDYDGLISAGQIGLIKAARRFDSDKGAKFKTFAENYIRGAVLDELRSQDWLTRPLRDKLKKLEHETKILEHRLGRMPSDEEVADSLCMGLNEYFCLIEKINSLAIVRLDNEVGDGISLLSMVADNGINSEEAMIKIQITEILHTAISELTKEEQAVIKLSYFEEMILKDIGTILQVNESRACQLRTQAIGRLKKKLSNKFKCHKTL